jgi:hypothetical protein
MAPRAIDGAIGGRSIWPLLSSDLAAFDGAVGKRHHAIALLTLRDASFQPDPTGEPSARDLVGRGDGDR